MNVYISVNMFKYVSAVEYVCYIKEKEKPTQRDSEMGSSKASRGVTQHLPICSNQQLEVQIQIW